MGDQEDALLTDELELIDLIGSYAKVGVHLLLGHDITCLYFVVLKRAVDSKLLFEVSCK